MRMQQNTTKLLLESGKMNTFQISGQNDKSIFLIALDKQSYVNILYLLVLLPLGLTYFVFLVSGIILGIATFFPVGVLILIFMMWRWLQIAAFERHMAIQLQHITIPPMSYPSPKQMTRWQRLQAQLTNSITWKTLGYLLLKFPLGIFSFVITTVLLV